jgi:hypothetical protein
MQALLSGPAGLSNASITPASGESARAERIPAVSFGSSGSFVFRTSQTRGRNYQYKAKG